MDKILNNKILIILVILILLYIVYFYLAVYKKYEYFEIMRDNNVTDLEKFNKDLIFYSNNYYSLDKIHDRFYSLIFDDICFNDKIYKEQGKLLLDVINKDQNYNYNVSLLIHSCMGVHLSETLKNLTDKIKTVEMSSDMVKVCKQLYKNKDCEYIDKELFNYYRFNNHEFTHILNTNNFIYYYSDDKLNKYFKNINEWLIPHGYFIINVIDDYLKIRSLHGSNNKNFNYLNTYYDYVLDINDDIKNNKMILHEKIKDKKTNKKRINVHKFNKHNNNKIINMIRNNGFKLMDIKDSNYKDNYKYLIFKKIN